MMLPPDHPDAPKYWMYETSGRLFPVVESYLDGHRLGPEEVAIMKAYLQQWFRSPVWITCFQLLALRRQVETIQTCADIDSCLRSALDLGIDPL